MNLPTDQLRFEYDDNVLDIVDKINAALAPRGLKVVSDEQAHDGFEIMVLTELKAP
jgi:hypothetical protein